MPIDFPVQFPKEMKRNYAKCVWISLPGLILADPEHKIGLLSFVFLQTRLKKAATNYNKIVFLLFKEL